MSVVDTYWILAMPFLIYCSFSILDTDRPEQRITVVKKDCPQECYWKVFQL